MQVLKEDIRGRILAVAEQRFGQQGYSKTSMREIAGAVGVGVGNIYNYFRNKDELFCEVVRPVLHAMEAMLQEHHGIRGEDVMVMRSEKYLKACIDEYVSLIETHRSLLEILLFRAQGSSLEHFRKSYTDRSTGLVKAWFAAMKKKYPDINTAVSDFIIHLHTVLRHRRCCGQRRCMAQHSPRDPVGGQRQSTAQNQQDCKDQQK